MPVSNVTVKPSFASVASDGDFTCGRGPKPGTPRKPMLQVVSSAQLRKVLSANGGPYAGAPTADLEKIASGDAKAEAQVFQALSSAISEVMKNFGGALQTAARG
jgi:hypothetical protein